MTDIDKLIEELETSNGLSPEQVDEIIKDQRRRLAMYEQGIKPKTKAVEDIDWEAISTKANMAVANMVGKVPAAPVPKKDGFKRRI